MKTYQQLTEAQQEKAREKALVELLKAILEGGIRFNDSLNGDGMQGKIDKACAEAEQMHTPWFAHEYVMDVVGDELRGMAQCDAEDAIYPEGERIIHLAV